MDLPYRAEYAKSNRASCRACKSTIDKDTLRFAIMVQSRMYDGKTPHWYHQLCFFTRQRPKTVNDIAHFESLRWEDQEKIKYKIEEAANKGTKRAKKDVKQFVLEYSKSSRSTCKGCKQQIVMQEIRISKKDYGTRIGRRCGGQDMWYHLPCFVILRAELGFFECGDQLSGFRSLSEYEQNVVKIELPALKQEGIPIKKSKLEDETDGNESLEKEMKSQNEVMFYYRDKLKTLQKKELVLLLETNEQELPVGREVILDRLADIMSFGALEPCSECNGGQFVFNKLGYICHGNLTEWSKCNIMTKEPKRRAFIVNPELKEKYLFLKTYKFVLRTRVFKEVEPAVDPFKKEENGNSNTYKSFKSLGLRKNKARIYQSGNDKYTVTLGLTDIQKQKNSYYKLQLWQANSGNRYWLFRSWGRIGTRIGDKKLEVMSLHQAKAEFCRLYEEKSGNVWSNRANFVKVPGLMYPVDVDYGDEEAELKINDNSDVPSKLVKPVQELIKLIFDVNAMRKVMLEFKLDTEKMPLGKLSKIQLQNAYEVLSELQQLVESGSSRPRLIDASNRFYTFVPHSFGVDVPTVIDDIEIVKKKVKMVDSLMELEIAYNLMKSSSGSGNNIDHHYEQLKTQLDVLEHDTEEFQIIQEYVKNTHAATHSKYELEIVDVFTVKRQGEEKRYKPFQKLHNRKLLWHGSRTTNFAGILSQGLRIAPPEAPVTGYMFGKGIYFADMVSKSANYCFTSRRSSTGLLLLCEVALGDMYELVRASNVEKLPDGKHSVKGLGSTVPDPQHIKELPGGVQVPVGKGIQIDRPGASSLLYNEYIVYDVTQVNIKYLLKMNFKYK